MTNDMPPLVYLDDKGQYRDLDTDRVVRVLRHVPRPRWKTVTGRTLVGAGVAALLWGAFLGPLLGCVVLCVVALFTGCALLGASTYQDTTPVGPMGDARRVR